MVIFEGKSEKPVYLYVCDDHAELLSVEGLWGMSVLETDEILHKTHQAPQLRVSAIGRAGEEGVLYACVVNDLHRVAGRSGVGTVMGSKNLKAFAVQGTVGVKVKDPMQFMKTVLDKKQTLTENTVTGQGLPTYGTHVLMNVINEVGALTTRNTTEVQLESASKIGGEAMHEPRGSEGKPNLVTTAACSDSTIAC